MGKKHKPKIEASRDYRGIAAKNLQAFENEKNITPSEAADIVGISYKRYITIRKDGTGLDAEKLGRLHDLGGVRIDKLLTDESGKNLLRNPEYESDHDGWRLIEKTTSVIEQCSSSKERFKMYMALLEKSMKGIKLQGKQLKTILRLAFLNGENQIMSKQEICSEMEISEATFNRRYPVAVVLFGILMWIYANRREQEDINAGIVDRPPYYKEKEGVC